MVLIRVVSYSEQVASPAPFCIPRGLAPDRADWALRFELWRRNYDMRRWLVALALMTACGPGIAQPLPSLSPPSPPTAALTAWKDFPANANPRPIIVFDRTVEHVSPAGFTAEPVHKLDWGCDKFVFAQGVTPPATAPGNATANGSSYTALGAVKAYSELMAARARFAYQASQCPTARPFVIKDVRWLDLRHQRDRRVHRVLGSRPFRFLAERSQHRGHGRWPYQRRRLDAHARYRRRPGDSGTVRRGSLGLGRGIRHRGCGCDRDSVSHPAGGRRVHARRSLPNRHGAPFEAAWSPSAGRCQRRCKPSLCRSHSVLGHGNCSPRWTG